MLKPTAFSSPKELPEALPTLSLAALEASPTPEAPFFCGCMVGKKNWGAVFFAERLG